MDEKIEKVKKDIETFLKDSVDHQNKHIDYILVDPDTNETYVLASDGNDEAIEFTPLSKNYEEGYTNVPEWDYNFDYYIYNYLEEGKQIAFMTDDVHYSLWNSINELYPEDIDYKDGVQWYLQYCADKGITKEYLDEKTGFNTPDIMKHFEGLAMFDTMEYKGYIIEADDANLDNPKENLVNIYENKQDFENKECIETVSLNTVGLKQNIRDYIDEFYVDKTVVQSEKAYFTFVLGYDLLNDMISKSSTPENDVSYDFCNMVAGEFLKSEEYKNEKYSSYEMLEKWVNDNKDFIKEQHCLFIGETPERDKARMLDNGMYVMDLGYRNKQPVALIERTMQDKSIEYIIAFNYKITDKKIEWAYGYYYNDDILKAKQDFSKVLSGGNLAETFNKNKKDKER